MSDIAEIKMCQKKQSENIEKVFKKMKAWKITLEKEKKRNNLIIAGYEPHTKKNNQKMKYE